MTDCDIKNETANSFLINNERLVFKSGVLLIGGTKIRCYDPREVLYEFRGRGFLPVNKLIINNILREYHILENHRC